MEEATRPTPLNGTCLNTEDLRRARGGKCNRCRRHEVCNAAIRAGEDALCNATMGFAQYREQQTGHRGHAKRILAWWRDNGPATAAVVAEQMEINYNTVAGTLGRLRKNGELGEERVYETPTTKLVLAEQDSGRSADGEGGSFSMVGVLRGVSLRRW